jgi:lipoprotein-anchoring transpeptidase ErfK/SrfK
MSETDQPSTPSVAVGEQAGRSARRRRRRWRVRLAILVGVCVLGAAGIAASLTSASLTSGGGHGSSTPRAASAASSTIPSTTTAVPVDRGPFTILTTKVGALRVYAQPTASSTVVATLAAKTEYGFGATLLVNPDEPSRPTGWLPVTVPLHKPNDTPGWVQVSDVTTSETQYAIRISLAQHTLVLLKGGQEVLRTSVIIGAPATLTPTGRFFVTDPLNCNRSSVEGFPVAQCGSAYGAFAIGTSGLSEKLDSFDGTIPQIAIHGMDNPQSDLGKDLSNGCVRMPNDVIVQIARITPLLGTPVTITA